MDVADGGANGEAGMGLGAKCEVGLLLVHTETHLELKKKSGRRKGNRDLNLVIIVDSFVFIITIIVIMMSTWEIYE